jgi:hypothetical protein
MEDSCEHGNELPVSVSAGNPLCSCEVVGFSRGTQRGGVS